VVLAAMHILFINRVRLARAFVATQREKDLERFMALKREGVPGSGVGDPESEVRESASEPN
jgi:hypothetical protein